MTTRQQVGHGAREARQPVGHKVREAQEHYARRNEGHDST